MYNTNINNLFNQVCRYCKVNGNLCINSIILYNNIKDVITMQLKEYFNEYKIYQTINLNRSINTIKNYTYSLNQYYNFLVINNIIHIEDIKYELIQKYIDEY